MRYRNTLIVAAVGMLASMTAQAEKDETPTGKMIAGPCFSCHGEDGKARNEYMPALAGLDAGAIADALRDYQLDIRKSVIMNRIAACYSDEEIRRVAEFFASVGRK